MSDAIQHECGLAYIRLLKPISYYYQKYGTAFYALNKMYLLMEKQHNRGQDGAGLTTLKLNVEPGSQFAHRIRVSGSGAIKEIFRNIHQEIAETEQMLPDLKQYPGLLKGYIKHIGEVMIGHLRYGTQGKNDVAFCHPFVKADINPSLHLTMAGNFNLINTEELFDQLNLDQDNTINQQSDLGAMIATIHHHLCIENTLNPANTNLKKVLKDATSKFDGGYVFGGFIGNGDSFVMRDQFGIRPAYYYQDDEIVIVASEKPAIITTLNIAPELVKELQPGNALIVKANGTFENVNILPSNQKLACSFERIYFSRGSDADIYRERIQLGDNLAKNVLESINYDLKNTIISFIPNTAEIAFYGLIKGLESYLSASKVKRIIQNKDTLTDDELKKLISRRVRIEKIAIKDVKLRTFITEDDSRDEMVQHVYDITYGTVRPREDTLVVIDDSIVRGTTLRQSIIKMLDRLLPKKIVIVSSAPQIRYPDCYGIDMSKMGDFIAFQATIDLLNETGKSHIIEEVYEKCLEAKQNDTLSQTNFVTEIYNQFSVEDISNKIAVLLKPSEVKAEVEIIYQSIEGLHQACPNNKGDWYFTGNYPTLGGNKVANQAFINFIEKKTGRGY